MSDPLKETKQQPVEKKVFAEARGKYSLLDGTKVFHFEFPAIATLEDNFAAIAYLKDEIFKTIQAKDKAENEKSDKKNDCTNNECKKEEPKDVPVEEVN